MLISLENRTALVCGSSEGIGRSIAERFATCGAKVVLFARNRDALLDLSNSLHGSGHDVLVADFDDPRSVRATLQKYVVNERRIDIIVNNSGGPPSGALTEAASDEFIVAMNRLLLSSQEIFRLCYDSMKSNGFGRIINIISTSVRQPIDNLGVSNTIRAATAAWSKTLSREVAMYGITVNNILPGATMTKRLEDIIAHNQSKTGSSRAEVTQRMLREIPAGRFAQPEEIAYLAAFLGSNYADYITGTSIAVDGGRTRSY